MTALWFFLRWVGILLFGLTCASLTLSALTATFHGIFRMEVAMTWFWAVLAGASVWYLARDTRAAWRGGASPATVKSELTIVCILLGLLAVAGVVVWPSFRQLLDVSQAGANKGNLGGLREAVSAYTAARGKPPESFADVVTHGYMKEIAPVRVKPHKKSNEVVAAGASPSDTGHWAYRVEPSSPAAQGILIIDCTHTDSKGSVWASY